MTPPRFSIVMPVFNGERYIEAAVSSVLDQTYRDFELLVSDDGSTDATVELVSRYAKRDPRVSLLRRTVKGGPGGNRNFAIAYARAEWIGFLDADDVWPPEHLELCETAIRTCPDAIIFFGDYRRFTDSIDTAAPSILDNKCFFEAQAAYVQEIVRAGAGTELFRLYPDRLQKFCCLYYCPISTQAVTLRRDAMLRNGIAFREDWVINEDFHVWMRMLETGPAVAIRQVLFFYRLNSESLTSSPIRYLEGMARSHGEWMRRVWPTLSRVERLVYRDKVAGFLHSVAWEHSHRGRVAAATSAHLRALRVRRLPGDILGVARTLLRAAFWRAWSFFGGRLPVEGAS